jgi:biotin transporter BioY
MFWLNWITGVGLEASFARAVVPFIPVSVVRTAVLPLIGISVKLALKKAGLPPFAE